MLILLATSALATDNGIQRLYDRQITCDFRVDPPPDPKTCVTGVRSDPPWDGRPTWGISIAPPGKLYFSMHAAQIDWGDVYLIETPRAFDPVLLSVGITKDDEACPAESVFYLNATSERGPLTKQVCLGIPWDGFGEVLLESHRKLPPDMWVPVWAWLPKDASLAEETKNWFLVQLYISSSGAAPEKPAQTPYVSPAVTRAWVPKPLPPRKRLWLLGPEPEPEVTEEDAPAP
ncbi:MAG: hypothetical protein H6737_30205 [Alphaproteobacteria bacterium]|nr:hypothetical protein [Alphaproteobacteria bacterium]